MKKGLIILLTVSLAVYFIYIGLQKKFYTAISQETLVGIIKCAKSRDRIHDFYLFYFPAVKDGQADFSFIKLKGKYWAFEGEIIKWKRPLNILGFKTGHRQIRIYDSEGTSYPLEIKPKRFIFKLGKILPCVDTSFISIVKQPFAPKIKFGIYATNTGYLVRRIR